MSKRSMTVAACLVCASLVAAGCGGDDDDNTSGSTTTTTATQQQTAVPAVVEVSIGDNFYKPEDLTVKVGQSIKWKNDGAVAHTVTSDSDSSVSFDSGSLNPRSVYVLKPTKQGKLTYYCTIHGKSQSGTITVERN
jgi:plastocyanin